MKGTLRLTPRKDKVRKDGRTLLRLTYSLHDQRKTLNTDVYIFPFLWDSKTQRVRYINKSDSRKLYKEKSGAIYKNDFTTNGYVKASPTDEIYYRLWQDTDYSLYPLQNDVNKLNKQLIEIEVDFQNIEDDFIRSGELFSSESIATKYIESKRPLTKKEDDKNLVFDYIDKYIQDNESSRAKGSMQVYKSLKKHLQNYQTAKRVKVRFDTINSAFMRSFQNFLIQWEEVNPRTKRVNTLANTTIAKQLSTLKTFLNYARKDGIEVNSGYRDFEIKKEKLEVIALTERELMLLVNIDLSKNERLDKTRDLFVFSATTGLRYSDLRQLRREHINGQEIKINVTKTKKTLTIPLNSISIKVLRKYKDNEHPLPRISNQRLNEYIKELCKLAEINEPTEIVRFKGAKRIVTTYPKCELISIHTGRKTFATLSLEKGINAETVMMIGGWESYSSFSRYVNITENVKKKAMEEAWGKPGLEIASSK